MRRGISWRGLAPRRRWLARSLAGRALPVAALLTTLCWAEMPGVASARKRAPEPTLEVTLVPTDGEPTPPVPITAGEVQANEFVARNPRESGMTVATLVSLVGIPPEQLHSITVTANDASSGYTMEGSQAIQGVPLAGEVYYAAFQTLNPQAIWFIWPPAVAEEPENSRRINGPDDGPLYVTLHVDGGLLKISPLEFSPAEPEAGKPVSFARPSATYPPGGRVAGLRYAWRFGDGEFSEEAEPKHSFEPERPDEGTYHYTVELLVSGTLRHRGVEVPVMGHQEVSIPVTVTNEQESSSPDGNGGPEQGGNADGSPSGTGPKSASPTGSPSGKANTPAARGQAPLNATTSQKTGLPGNGSGGSGHGSGTRAHNGSTNGPRAGGAGARSQHTIGVRRPDAKHAGTPRGLVGVLLEAHAGKLPTELVTGDASPSQSATALLADATPGSSGNGGPVGLLGWVAGILIVVIVLCAGGLTELRPGAPYRKLAAG
jgi:hypothetical protein